MRQKCLILLLPAIWVSSAELAVKEVKLSEPTSQCLLYIINEYLNTSKKIAVRHTDDENQKTILEELIKRTNNPLMINADEYSRGLYIDNRMPSDTTIILSEDVDLSKYLNNNIYTAGTVFFTVFWKNPEEIGRVFEVFWQYNIVNSYVMEVREKEINIYEYIPYANCSKNEPVLLDKWTGGGFRYKQMHSIRKNQIITANGCMMTVAVPSVPPTIIFPNTRKVHGTNRISGLEGRIWEAISEKINSTFWYKVPDDGVFWGFVLPPSGAVGELIQKKSHFAGGGPSPTLERVAFLEAIVGTSGASDTVVWVVPKGSAKSHPVWLRIFTIEFSLPTWVCLAVILALTVQIHSAFSRFSNISSPIGPFNSFLILFASSLRAPVKMPKSLPLKTLLASWIWYTFIVITAYESVMRSTLTVPIRHQEMNTLRELAESKMDLYGIETTIKVVLVGTNDPYKEAISKRVKVWNSSLEQIMELIATHKNTGYMREKLTVDYFLFNHKEFLSSIHQMKQYAYLYYQTVYMQKRFPLFRRVQSIVSHLRESGISAWWRTLYTRESYPIQPKVVKLTTEHMTAPFTILGAGYMSATIAFVVENIKYRLKKL